MKYISDEDREYIDNKYHLKGGDFNPLSRFSGYHGYEFDPSTGLNDKEMEEGLEKLFIETKNLEHSLAKAKAFEFVLDNARIDTSEKDYFFGFYNWGRPLSKTFIQKWHKQTFDSLPKIKELMKDYYDSGTAELTLDFDHMVPNWMDILSLGFKGLLERSEKIRAEHTFLTEKQKSFFEAIKTEYLAIIRLIKRIADYNELHQGEKSPLVIKSLRSIAENPPQNFFEALLCMYVYFITSESVDQFQTRSMGNGFDRSLYGFYKRDLENRSFTQEEMKKFLGYFMYQFSSIGNYWGQPFYLCGTAFDEKTDISELTVDILEVYEDLGGFNPKIQIKLDYNTNEKIVYKVLDMIRNGQNSFVFCCVPGITRSLMSCYGVSEFEARNCDISGCNEMHVRANEACMTSAFPNAAKALLYVFFNGVDTITKKKIGIKTGEPESFKSFEDFYDAFLKQLAHVLDQAIEASRLFEQKVAEVNPSVMLSATIERSLKKAIDAYGFGVKYTNSAILLCSFATAVDSLLAVKELVFEKKLTTLSELKQALLNNWKGYEKLRLTALNAKKYGNGDLEADRYAAALLAWFSIYIGGKKNSRGGIYKAGVPSTRHFISQGKRTEATPDGRMMGEECSRNVAPVIGMERKGVTALMRSAVYTQPWLFSEAYVLDVMLHPSAVSGKEGLEAMKALLYSYMKNDGVSIQFNVFSSLTLKDAQNNPEKYKNLQVRVSGWNVLWNDLSKNEQEAYIKRAESIEN